MSIPAQTIGDNVVYSREPLGVEFEAVVKGKSSVFSCNNKSCREIVIVFTLASVFRFVNPSRCCCAISHYEKAIFRAETTLDHVNPWANQTGEEFQEVYMGSSEEVVWEFNEPILTPRVPPSNPMLARIYKVTH